MGIASKAAGMIGSIFSAGASELVDSAFTGLDGLITSEEEKGAQSISIAQIKAMQQSARYEYNIKRQELEFKIKDQEYADRASAREMGKTDPWTPRLLTIIFTVAYFFITGYMMVMVLQMIDKELSNFAVSFISTIFGAFNAIMIQIISYYFGASKGGDDQGAKIAESFNNAAK